MTEFSQDAFQRREPRNRVKLYVLCEERVWDDRGTGHVACVQQPGQGGQESFVIVVRHESTEKNVLESKILMDTVYQKQQETLIVWSESDTCDLALSFQEKAGCEELWAKICEVQGKDPGEGDGELEESDASDGTPSGQRDNFGNDRRGFPAVTRENLDVIDAYIGNHMSSAAVREKMSDIIEDDDVIPKLIKIFHTCEESKDSDGLRLLYTITKNVILLNHTSVLDVAFDEKHLRDIIGMLEYDPAHAEPRKHREFLFEKAKFREVLPVSEKLRDKIHQVYRVQYIQDMCLPAPSILDENLMGTLNSFLFLNRLDICQDIQKDKQFMKDLFDQLKSPETLMSRKKDLVSFLREFIQMSQGFPNGGEQKDGIIKGLIAADILNVIEPCITSIDFVTRTHTVDIVSALVEHNPQLLREFLIKQAKSKNDEEVLLNRFITHMLTDQEPELTSGNMVANILRTLLDPDNMVTMQKTDRSEFLQMFYQRSLPALVKPMLANLAQGKVHEDDYCTANKEVLVLRLLCFCVEHHSFLMRQHCISTDLLGKLLVLFDSRHHFVALSALKLLRTVLGAKDDFYNRYIIREKILDRVVAFFQKNGPRNNLLNSAILELFHFIGMDDVRSLIKYIGDNHSSTFDDITYVTVFADLKKKYEMQVEKESAPRSVAPTARPNSPSPFLKERQEEQWYEKDEEEDEFAITLEDGFDSTTKMSFSPKLPKPDRPLSRVPSVDDDYESPVLSGLSKSLIGPKPFVEEKKPKLTLKINSKSPGSSPSPSPSPPPSREDEVSSSENSKESSPSSSDSNSASSSKAKSLVDYDSSDSDSDNEDPLDSFLRSASSSSPANITKGDSPTDDAVSSSSDACESSKSVETENLRPAKRRSDPVETMPAKKFAHDTSEIIPTANAVIAAPDQNGTSD